MVLCGIVTFNPEISRLEENLKAIVNQVDKILVIDNKSNNLHEIRDLLRKYNIEIQCNNSNYGIAYALNQILDYALLNNYEWFLTLDQDSVAQKDLIKKYLEYIQIDSVAIITCNITDRNYETVYKDKEEFKYINQCITSGSFNNTKIMKKIGGFDNKMFIDFVDFDICATVRENNYKIIRINYNGLLHEVGHTKIVRILWKKEKIYNHSPFRTYYIIRNSIYYNKKHKTKHRLIANLKILKRILLILIFQNNKKENLKAIVKGYKDSKKML